MKLLLTALLALSTCNAGAKSAGGEVQVGATVLASCTSSGTALDFGASIDPLKTRGAIDASAALNVTCTNTTPYSVALNAGANAAGSSTGSRRMTSGGNSLPYQLYLDAARNKVWGEGSDAYGGTGTGSTQVLTIYGRLPSLSGVAPGRYNDTVTVTISY